MISDWGLGTEGAPSPGGMLGKGVFLFLGSPLDWTPPEGSQGVNLCEGGREILGLSRVDLGVKGPRGYYFKGRQKLGLCPESLSVNRSSTGSNRGHHMKGLCQGVARGRSCVLGGFIERHQKGARMFLQE